MVWHTYVGFTGDGIREMEVIELIRRRWFGWLDMGGRLAKGLAWSSSWTLVILTPFILDKAFRDDTEQEKCSPIGEEKEILHRGSNWNNTK